MFPVCFLSVVCSAVALGVFGDKVISGIRAEPSVTTFDSPLSRPGRSNAKVAGYPGSTQADELVDDFETDFVHWKPSKTSPESSEWILSQYGSRLPDGFLGKRPPPEENSSGYVEVIPHSPAHLHTDFLRLLPGASVQVVYWNAANPSPIRTTLRLQILTKTHESFYNFFDGSPGARWIASEFITIPVPEKQFQVGPMLV